MELPFNSMFNRPMDRSYRVFQKPENEQCNKLRKFVRQKDHKHNFPMINVIAKFVSYHINPKASIVNMTIRKNGHSMTLHEGAPFIACQQTAD